MSIQRVECGFSFETDTQEGKHRSTLDEKMQEYCGSLALECLKKGICKVGSLSSIRDGQATVNLRCEEGVGPGDLSGCTLLTRFPVQIHTDMESIIQSIE